MSVNSSPTTQSPDVEDIQWFHSFELPDGQIIEGIKPLETLRAEADLFFGESLEGKSVLDIGAWDGFFSFEAERRGASRVLAADHFCWSGPGWGPRAGFDRIHATINSSVESLDIDVLDLSPSTLGQFDIVLFLGVLYHVKDPYVTLETASRMCSDHLVVETVTALPAEPLPAMRLYKPFELGGDPTNFWAPNIPALEVMLDTFGFAKIEAMPSPASPRHPLSRHRNSRMGRLNNSATHRTILHAWR